MRMSEDCSCLVVLQALQCSLRSSQLVRTMRAWLLGLRTKHPLHRRRIRFRAKCLQGHTKPGQNRGKAKCTRTLKPPMEEPHHQVLMIADAPGLPAQSSSCYTW